jgi:signal peptidase I
MAAGTKQETDASVSDHYALLGVRFDASPQQIEAAYRRVALERGYQDGAWRELRDAYDVLRDPEQRARYDLGLDGSGPQQKKSRNPVDRLFPNLPHGWRVALDWIVTIAGAVAIVLAIKAWIVNPYRIPSSSMEPTLHCARPAAGCEASTSDRVLANRFIYHFHPPHRGDIVVFKTPKLAKQECGSEGTFVKRLIGLPGDVWEEREGYVYINGRKLIEPYIKPIRRDHQNLALIDIPPRGKYTRIPKNYYLMMGDNRNSSCDSRRWGLVPRKNLIGKVFATYWPPSRISLH